MKRYQECPWYVRLWRRRWYLTIPFRAARIWTWELANEPRWKMWTAEDGKVYRIPGRMGIRNAWRLATGVAQVPMGWYFTLEQVDERLGRD